MSPLRVLMVSSNWPPANGGGAEAYVAELADALRARGHDVAAVTLGIGGNDVVAVVPPRPHRLDNHGRSSGLQKVVFHGHDLWRFDVTRTLQQAVERFAPDVVHTHVVTGMSVSALAAPSRLGVPHVHTLHDHWLRCWRSTGTTARQQPCGPACAALERARAGVLRRHGPHVVIGISDAVLARHVRLQPGARFTVIRHPGPPTAPTTGPKRADVTFGFLGQLNPNKGVRVFLEAARRMSATGMRFVVAGRGRLEAEVAAADLPNLEYRGWVEGAGKDAFFADIDCLVVPSVWEEPAGLVVGEAVARGVPVIASAIGGLPEYVPAACRRLLCPPRDPFALTSAMHLFAASPDEFSVDPSEAGSWDDHIAAVVEAYRSARMLARAAA